MYPNTFSYYIYIPILSNLPSNVQWIPIQSHWITMKNALDDFLLGELFQHSSIFQSIYILYHIYYLSLYSMVIFIYTLHFIWLVVDLPILKNMSSSMVGGWHPIYEMENNPAIIQPCSKPPTSYGMYPLQYTNIEKRQKQWDTIPKLTVTIAGINPENMGALLFLY